MRQCMGTDKIVGIQVGATEYLPPPPWRVLRFNTAMLASTACIVNNHIKTSKLFYDRMDHVFYGIFTRYIRLEKYSNAALIR